MKIGTRLWILIIALFLALLALAPWNSFKSGVVIKSVEKNTTYFEQGLKSGMVIQQINGNQITNIDDYTQIVSEIFNFPGEKRVDIKTDQGDFVFYTNETPTFTVANLPKTNLKMGLDLVGGARALVRPVNVSLSSKEMQDLIAVTSERFNVYGLADITVRPVKDLEGNNYMLIEIAGATPSDLEELVGKQGKFEAKIGNETVFIGGKKDITFVCRNNAQCSRVERPIRTSNGYASKFTFSISLSEEAAERHANITSKLNVNLTQGGRYLDKKLDLYLDDQLVDSLLISEDLKGRPATEIAISGSGFGTTQQDAINDAFAKMNKLQTILITGSLPYKLEIVKLDTISPKLGESFIKNLLIAGIAALISVAIIIFVRYRNFKSSLAILLTSFSEVLIILGVASLIKWNLDLASIAGILTVIGTGVDQQIILIDESKTGQRLGIVEKIKRALFIIVGAYFTSLASLIPLYWAGAGLLRGFAVTTIIGITTGVLITRPAFAEIVRRIES